jgi:hypothetical protein
MAAGAATARIAPYVAAAIPLIQDLFSGGSQPAPEKVAALQKVRDDMVQRMVAGEGISPDRALEVVNEQLKPLIESGGESGGGAGDIASDAIGAAGALALGSKFGGARARRKAIAGRKASMGRRPAADERESPAMAAAETPAAEAAETASADPDLVAEMVAARLREMSPPLPGGGGLDMANAAMGTGRGTRGMKRGK